MLKFPDYRCSDCGHVYGLPLDNCSICGNQFYWLVVTSRHPDSTLRATFLTAMSSVSGDSADPAFLFHDGLLWLPHNYWEQDPTGQTLDRWAAVERLECHQHSNEPLPAAERLDAKLERRPEVRGTPAMPATTPVREPAPPLKVAEPSLPTSQDRVSQRTARPVEPRNMNGGRAEAPSEIQAEPFTWRDWRRLSHDSHLRQELYLLFKGQLFVPAMLFLFFIFLALSALTLNYYKHHRSPMAVSHSEVRP